MGKRKESSRTLGTDRNPSLDWRFTRMAIPVATHLGAGRPAARPRVGGTTSGAVLPPGLPATTVDNVDPRGHHHGRRATAARPRTRGKGEAPAAPGITRARNSMRSKRRLLQVTRVGPNRGRLHGGANIARDRIPGSLRIEPPEAANKTAR